MRILVTLLWILALLEASTARAGGKERKLPLRWFVQTAPLVILYHDDFGYTPGMGAQMAVGRCLRAGMDGVLKFTYCRPSQNFSWLGETQSLKTDWYRWQFALRLCWPSSHTSRFHLFAEMQGGWAYLHPHTLALDGGVQGPIFINANDEIKFAPALSGGFSYHLARRVAVYLQIEFGYFKQASRRLNEAAAAPAWKPLRQLGAGVTLCL
ncbi:MAG: hypothetical protein ACREOO_06335 [bacterium]